MLLVISALLKSRKNVDKSGALLYVRIFLVVYNLPFQLSNTIQAAVVELGFEDQLPSIVLEATWSHYNGKKVNLFSFFEMSCTYLPVHLNENNIE